MNTNKLKGKIVEKGLNIGDLADEIGMDRATLYRKIKEESFSIKEASLICEKLDLTRDEVMAIFFTHYVA